MLTPEYLASFSSGYLGMVDNLNEQIVRDIARRITKTGKITDTAKWQLKQSQESGMLLNDIIKDVGKFTGYSDKQIKIMFDNAGVIALNNDAKPLLAAGKITEANMSTAMHNLMVANANKFAGDIKNLTLTTASTGQNAYMQALNEAYMKVQSGAFSYQEALKQAIRKAAADGGKVFYDSGASSSLDAALRRSLLTGLNQTAAKLTEMYAEDMDVEYYETSAHSGARPSHAEWQGKVFKIHGASGDYNNFYDATGYGEVTGLCGVNCRHSFYPYWPGISKPAYSKEKLDDYEADKYSYRDNMLTDYECNQMLRNMERQIRDSKRILTGYDAAMKAATDAETESYMKSEFSQEAVKLKAREKRMKEFCSQTNRSPDTARTQVHAVKDLDGNIVNYGRSTSMKAVWANRKEGK